MLYLFKVLVLFLIIKVSLSAMELSEYKNNFYIHFDTATEHSFSVNHDEPSIKRDIHLYGIGYLRQINDFYLGASLKFFSNDKLYFSLLSEEDNKKVNIQRKRDLQIALQLRYKFFEFENIKLLLGADFGSQINSLNLNYNASRLENIKEEYNRELDIGEVIDDKLSSECNVSIIGNNIIVDPITGENKVIGHGVYCYGYSEVKKEIEYSQNIEIMRLTFPININFTILYGLTNNIDLGIGLGLTIIENVNINYSDNFIKLNTQQSLSYHSLSVLINYKIGNKKRK